MHINHSSIRRRQRITAADDNVFNSFDDAPDFGGEDDDEAIGDQIDTIQDNLEDVQDAVEDIQEDDTVIDIDNNIADHLIAECDNCKNVFISAMIVSDQDVDSINGICPVCKKETTQSLKWIIKNYPEDNTI